ncbi:MAG: type II secretion system F family protein, partial [bacterium]
MEYLFASIFSLSAGWLGFRLFAVFLDRVGTHQQNLQIKKMTGIFTGVNPFGIDARGLVHRAGFWTRFKLLRTYSEFLSRLIQRSAKPEWSSSDVMVGQVLILFFLFLLFQLLLDNLVLSAGLSMIGAFLPVSWIRDLALRREAKILRDFPNALETLSLCAEAGLSLERGLSQYLETAGRHPLADELGKILEQTKLGSSRKDALRAFERRLRLSDVALFVTSVIHAEKFGTGIAKTLRQLSET